MSTQRKTKGPFAQRFFIVILSIVFGILLFWLLSFVTNDIRRIPGPKIADSEKQLVDSELLSQQNNLGEQLKSTTRDIKHQNQQQTLIKENISSLQTTINQLLKIQDSSIAKGISFSQESQKTLNISQSQFLKDQQKRQDINQAISNLTTEKQRLEKQKTSVDSQVNEQKKLANKHYNKLRKKHNIKIASLKLSILLPILLIASWFMLKKRTGTFGPLVYAAFLTIFLQVAIVIHSHFESEYLKYIALLVIIGVVLKFLIYLLKNRAAPKKDFLIKQYQQSYDKGICPICAKPIHFAPLAFVRKKIKYPPAKEPEPTEYACPSCGTNIYKKCQSCESLRHSLLPYCKNCGKESQK